MPQSAQCVSYGLTPEPQFGQLASRDAGSTGWRVVKMARMSCEIFAWRACEVMIRET